MKLTEYNKMVEAVSRIDHSVTMGYGSCDLSELHIGNIDMLACVFYSAKYLSWLNVTHMDTIWS